MRFPEWCPQYFMSSTSAWSEWPLRPHPILCVSGLWPRIYNNIMHCLDSPCLSASTIFLRQCHVKMLLVHKPITSTNEFDNLNLSSGGFEGKYASRLLCPLQWSNGVSFDAITIKFIKSDAPEGMLPFWFMFHVFTTCSTYFGTAATSFSSPAVAYCVYSMWLWWWWWLSGALPQVDFENSNNSRPNFQSSLVVLLWKVMLCYYLPLTILSALKQV